jgi:predicted Zn-dependent peptidase
VLDVVERLISGGESTRLYVDLVREHEIATEVQASNGWGIDPELFWVYAQARPGKTAADLERRIDAVVDRLAREPVPEDELRKAKNMLRAEFVRGVKTVSGARRAAGHSRPFLGDYRAMPGLRRKGGGPRRRCETRRRSTSRGHAGPSSSSSP